MPSIESWLQSSVTLLNSHGIQTAQLDAELLLTDALNKDRTWLIAHNDEELTDELCRLLDRQIARRCKHEPIAYIRGKQEFYGHTFIVSPDTLTPRPETEALVDEAFSYISSHPSVSSVSDIGTGSGCIILSVARKINDNIKYAGYDVSSKALAAAEKNRELLDVQVQFVEADFRNDTSWFDSELIVANLPYVPEDFHINLAATHEPRIAIFGGMDGLDLYRSLFKLANKPLSSVTAIITESLPTQHQALEEIAYRCGFALQKTNDFIQLFIRR